MSKTIKEKSKELIAREEKLKLKLQNSESDLMSKAKSAGKIALITGLVALIGYWIYSAFWGTTDEPDKPKKKKKRKRDSNLAGTLFTYILPYITRFLDEILEVGDLKKEVKKELEASKEKLDVH